jgi:mediator of RNA polymerase II transcription subunit 17
VARLTLAHVLARITTEHGPTFANVTEEKLQTQIDKLDDDDDDADMEDVNPNNDAKQVTREDLIKIVQYPPTVDSVNRRVAFEESSLAQDFTSLLLSSARPAAGGASMSPALKAVVPLGALSGARIFPQPSQKVDLDVSIGWKKSALEGASQTLLSTADRMTRNLGNTGRFVDGVLKIRAAGWGIVQMPAGGGEAQQGVLKVYYGFQKGMSFGAINL